MIFRLLSVTAVSLIAACATPATGGSTVPKVAAGIPPLGLIGNVTLGQSLQSLRSHRPHAQPLSYVGLTEVVAGDSVFYAFAGRRPIGDYGVESSMIFDDDADLRGVYTWKHFESDRAADSAWASAVRSLTTLHGPATCRTTTSPLVRSITAQWTTHVAELAVLFSPAWTGRSITGDINYPASIRILVAFDVETVMPELKGALERPCP